MPSCCECFLFYIVHIYNLKNIQDDVVDENVNLKSSAGSIYIKSSRSGSATSLFVTPSDTAEAVTFGSKSPIILDSLKQILVETFNISPQLMQ